jgi:shikimate kinase
MRGVGRTRGAIGLVNALTTGVGAAMGVALPVMATVELQEIVSDRPPELYIAPDCDTTLVRQSLTAGLREFGVGRSLDARVSVRSDVPRARGLKSSSAVSSAVLLAVADSLGERIPAERIGQLSADVSQIAGVSATGAFDDAMAAITGDVVVTDNPTRSILRREPVDPRWRAVVWIRPLDHPPAPAFVESFARYSTEGREAVAHALAGDYMAAMSCNTVIVERVLGRSHRSLHEALLAHGALASGVSGLGPTIAALVPAHAAAAVSSVFPSIEGEVRIVAVGAAATSQDVG